MTDQAPGQNVSSATERTRRARRAVFAAYGFALLVMVLIPPFESQFGHVIEYASVFERPHYGLQEDHVARIMWGRVATQIVWATIAAGLGFAVAPMIARRAHRRP